jgi:hypothetical protein
MAHLSYREIVPRLRREVPELAPTLTEHIRDYDEVLPHVFFGDVTRYVCDELARGRVDAVRSILTVLEMAVTSPDREARDLVGASFLENLESKRAVFDALSALAGPEMRQALKQECNRRGINSEKST